jgi:nitrite reductase/ring-hydroxylating ferredoxin subunit
MKKFILVFLLICCNSMFFSCSKDETETIPYSYVNFYINPNSTMYYKLNVVGGWEYLTGGYNGIIVYRLNQDEFVAFDRACPYDYANGCRIEVESSFTTAIDSCCSSRFIITDGSPFSGPAHVSLKQYRTTYDGNNLHITN